MVRKNKKRFVRNVIIIAIIGLIVMMIGLFIVLQTYLGNQDTRTRYIAEEIDETVEPSVELSENLVILVEKINSSHIEGYDIHNRKDFNKNIDNTIKISDAYGNVLPISEIHVGDIVDVDYQSQKDKVMAISKSSETQVWKRISGVIADTEAKKVSFSGTSYAYSDETFICDSHGMPSSIINLDPFDVVSIQVIDDAIWSITVNEESASLSLSNLPTSNGQIEIGNSRLLAFKDVTEPIKLIPGTYKIVIKMKGYVTITKEITVKPGEMYELDLSDAEIAYTIVEPMMSSKIKEYTITIGDKVYMPGEEIKLQQGEYNVTIAAEGYEIWAKDIVLQKDVYKLSVAMVPLPVETEKVPGTDEVTTPANNNQAINASRTITINSDPSGAKVYIDGALKGTTPYTVTLNHGTYGILLEKSEYEVYSTSILIDGSNDQSYFLYQMVPIVKEP